MNRLIACLGIMVLVCGITEISADDPVSQKKPDEVSETQQIKVKTELMEIRTVVMDRKGQIVENLKKEDFELLENEKSQEISFFSVSQIESERSRPADVGAGEQDKSSKAQSTRQVQVIQDNTTAPKSTRERLSEAPVRTTLLYIDDLHLSFSSLNRVKQALRRFLKERVTEQDLVAIAASTQTLGIGQQFTRDRQILSYAIEHLRLGPTRHNAVLPGVVAAGVLADRIDAVQMAVELMRQDTHIECGCDNLRGLALTEAFQSISDAAYARKAMASTIEQYAAQMVKLPGKRMIVVFSDGFTLYDNDSGVHVDQLQPAIDSAVRSGVVIYTVDARGLQVPPTIDAGKSRGRTDPNRIDRGSTEGLSEEEAARKKAENETCKDAPYCPDDPKYCDPRCFVPDVSQLSMYLHMAEREEQNGLAAMANETGGEMYTNHNDLDVALSRAFSANRFYYVLSYYLPPGPEDHRFRNIRVRVRNHPEYTVRTARGFSLPDMTAKLETDAAKTPQQRLIQAMGSPLPITDLGVSAQADFIETEDDDKQVSLTVLFDGDRFRYKQQSDRNTVELEIIYAVFDSSGKQVEGMSAHVEGSLTQKGLAQAQTVGYRFARRLMLKPGVYQARVGVREEETNRIGTATTWVEVPQISRDKLELSDLILRNQLETDRTEKEGIGVGELEQVRMVQSIPLYTRTDFGDYSFRVHPQKSAGSGLLLMKEFVQGDKTVKQEQWKPVSDEEAKALDSKGWFEIEGEVDFSQFDPGVYELRISVKDSRENKPVRRTAVFSVE